MSAPSPPPSPDRRSTPILTRPGGYRWSDDPDLRAEFEAVRRCLAPQFLALRERAGWSEEQCAALAGIARQTLRDLEEGIGDPQLSTLVRYPYPHGYRLQITLVSGALSAEAGNSRS